MKKEEQLSKLIEHNRALYKGDRAGTLKGTEVQGAYEANLESFIHEVTEARQGKKADKYGRVIPAIDVSMASAASKFFGIIAPDKDAYGVSLSRKQKELFIIKRMLKQMDVYFGSDTLASTAQRFGDSNLNVSSLNSLVVAHSSFDALNSTPQIPADYRFVIPELIMAAIRLDYQGGMQHMNWIAGTQVLSQKTVVMPQLLRGNAIPRKIGEAESIPFGTIRYGQKSATVFKVGIGFKITDELIDATPLDMLFQFLGEVGTEMAICTDYEANRVLLNGEQADLSESAPVIGVYTDNSLVFKDIKHGTTRMQRLKRNPTRIITSEDEGINLSLLDEFKGFNGGTKLTELQNVLGIPATLVNDVFVMPSNQVMLLSPDDAMMKLQWKGMKTESRRNPQNGEDELFVSDYVGFAIKRRDGRLIIDKSLTYGSPDNATFPSYMDVDARITQSYKTIQE